MFTEKHHCHGNGQTRAGQRAHFYVACRVLCDPQTCSSMPGEEMGRSLTRALKAPEQIRKCYLSVLTRTLPRYSPAFSQHSYLGIKRTGKIKWSCGKNAEFTIWFWFEIFLWQTQIFCVFFFLAGQLFADTLQHNQDATFGKEMFNNVCLVSLQWENKLKKCCFFLFLLVLCKRTLCALWKHQSLNSLPEKGGGYCTGPWPDREQCAALPAEFWDEYRRYPAWP